jgi:hypothetical protein
LERTILKQLTDERELNTEAPVSIAETLLILGKLFVDAYKQVPVGDPVSRFATRRHRRIMKSPHLPARSPKLRSTARGTARVHRRMSGLDSANPTTAPSTPTGPTEPAERRC